jgi:two-component system CheB/CheR fusion protein
MKLDEEPRPTEVDPTQLESVLLNLAVNAQHAMPDGGALTIASSKIELDEAFAARRADVSPGAYTLLSVTDNGAGMTKEVLSQVFDPFFTTKEVGQGSGLGLSMAFGFTKQSGGHIEIESELGVGTTVNLYLPHASSQTQTPKPPEQVTPVSLGEKILVVEDDPEMLAVTTTLLDNLGYSVIEATNGENALGVLETEDDIDLLLTDIVMPGGLNGLALAKKAKQAYPRIKVLFMSGYATDAINIEGAEELEMNLLRKPFRVSEMAKTLRGILDQ